MTWDWPDNRSECAPRSADLAAIDRIARALATAAGEDWEKLRNHPGFGRGRWRDRAREITRG